MEDLKDRVKSNSELGIVLPARMFTRKQPDKQETLMSVKGVKFYSVAAVPSLSEPRSGPSRLRPTTGSLFFQAAQEERLG